MNTLLSLTFNPILRRKVDDNVKTKELSRNCKAVVDDLIAIAGTSLNSVVVNHGKMVKTMLKRYDVAQKTDFLNEAEGVLRACYIHRSTPETEDLVTEEVQAFFENIINGQKL